MRILRSDGEDVLEGMVVVPFPGPTGWTRAGYMPARGLVFCLPWLFP
jgi:hypothetical protein